MLHLTSSNVGQCNLLMRLFTYISTERSDLKKDLVSRCTYIVDDKDTIKRQATMFAQLGAGEDFVARFQVVNTNCVQNIVENTMLALKERSRKMIDFERVVETPAQQQDNEPPTEITLCKQT